VNKEQKLEIRRHSLAHILASAVLEMFPEAKFGVGPAIENGFYYDFDLPRTLIPEDVPILEDKMKEIIRRNVAFEKRIVSCGKALELFKKAGQDYKVEILSEEAKKGDVSIYRTGDFVDLCRGPHIDSTGEIDPESFKITKIAGAYWRGDEKNKMLQRIYGVAFENEKKLKEYLKMLEQAKKRDHRKLGRELDLFIFSGIVGSGLPLWTPRGSIIRRELEQFIIKEEVSRGYMHVYTPELAKVDLYKKSGHYPFYKDSMYPVMKIDNDELILRPMSCPHHFQLFLSRKRSYKDLPMRIAELAKLFRYEKSGELTGLIRVRSFCLADAHIICRKNQADDEINNALDLIEYVAETLKIKKTEDYWYVLSLGDRSDDKKYYKNDLLWEKSEDLLRNVLKSRKTKFFEVKGEAAFYGPKIDIQMKNIHGKEDTAFTVQFDFCMPDRFNLVFTNEENKEEKAVVIHRSSIGALERVIAFLIEKNAGKFPVWLSPVQVRVLPVSSIKHIDYARKVFSFLLENDVRVEIDEGGKSVSKRIHDAEEWKIPYMLVVGDKEKDSNSVAVRKRGLKNIEDMKVEEFAEMIKKEINAKK